MNKLEHLLLTEGGAHKQRCLPPITNWHVCKKVFTDVILLGAQVDEHALVLLVALLRVSSPLAKSQLQRLFLNLCQHNATMHSAVQIIMCLLRAPLSADEASAARPPGPPAAPPEQPASLADALQVGEPFKGVGVLGSIHSVTPRMSAAVAPRSWR